MSKKRKESGYYSRKDGSYGYNFSDGSGYSHGANGTYKYTYSDGSSYVSGADGSRGQTYSDGSGYYDGGDGSHWTKYSDGSGYYTGSDGSSWTKYSDGTCYHRDSKGRTWTTYSKEDNDSNDDDEYSYYYDNDDDDDDDDEDSYYYDNDNDDDDSYYYDNDNQYDDIDDWEENIASEKIWKNLPLYNLKVGISSSECMSYDVDALCKHFDNQGFSYIYKRGLNDLRIESKSLNNSVYDVSINNNRLFIRDSKFPASSKIYISYHSMIKIKVPITSADAKGKKIYEIVNLFKDSGFYNVKTIAKNDNLLGFLKDEGDVENITINDAVYNYNDRFRIDSPVIITYHSQIKKSLDELTPKCKSCGYPLYDDNSDYCPMCEKKQDDLWGYNAEFRDNTTYGNAFHKSEIKCKYCGCKLSSSKSKFCPMCGKRQDSI